MDDKKAYDKCMKLRDALEDLLERRCRVKASVKEIWGRRIFLYGSTHILQKI